MRINNITGLIGGSHLVIAALLATAAHAQDVAPAETAAAEAAAEDASVGEIVVTARRSAERLQDVPLSITAQTGELMLEKGITDLESLARFTPSLQFKDFVTTFHGNATIRGLSQVDTLSPVGNVGIFVDGIYLQRGYMVDTSLGDWQRVEVVKGPQSALYGQNTFSGAINFVTNTPTDELKVNAQVTAGNYGRKEIQVGVGGPIVEDILAARLYVGKLLYDGSWKNNAPVDAGDLERFGGSDREAYSAKLLFTPTDAITMTASYQQNRRKEWLRPYYAVDGTSVDDRLNCGPIGPVTRRPSLFCGTFPTDPSGLRIDPNRAPKAPFSVEQPPTVTKTEVANITAGWQASDELFLQYQYGYARGEAAEDTGSFTNNFNPTGIASRNFQHEGGILNYRSHEVRASWKPSDIVSFDTGYLRWKSNDRFIFFFQPVLSGQPNIRFSSDPIARPAGAPLSRNFHTFYETDSVFGRANVKLLDERLTLGAEGRYNWTNIRFFDLIAVGSPALEADYNTFAPRFTADYQLTPRNMIYASAAKGLKNGGFNGRFAGAVPLNPSEQAFGEEENWTYEIGSKNSFFDNTLIVNLTAFYVDWSKKQSFVQPQNYTPPAVPVLGVVPPNIFAVNGAAESYGLELDGLWRATPEFTISYSASLMNPTYADGTIAGNFIGLCTGDNCPVSADIGGNQIERTSKFAGTLGANYTTEMTDNWDFFVGGDVTYQSRQFADAVNAAKIAPFSLVNTRVGVENDRWKAFFWTNNLFDKKYVQSVFVIQNLRNNQVAFGERRTVGVTVALNF